MLGMRILQTKSHPGLNSAGTENGTIYFFVPSSGPTQHYINSTIKKKSAPSSLSHCTCLLDLWCSSPFIRAWVDLLGIQHVCQKSIVAHNGDG